MLLFINNETHINPHPIRKALRFYNIPFYEVKKIQEIPRDIHVKIKGILISGSLMRISKPLLFSDFAHILHYLTKYNNVPVLGLCFGCQVLHVMNGGKIEDQIERSCEDYPVELSPHPLFRNVKVLKEKYHQFQVCFYDLPILFSKCSHIALFYHRGKILPCAFEYSHHRYGMMIHPESHVETYPVFRNFADLCGI